MDDEPELPGVLQYLWEWFWELARRRGGGLGPAPITWQELDAWAGRTGKEPTPWEAALIMRLDDAYLHHLAEKNKEKGAEDGE